MGSAGVERERVRWIFGKRGGGAFKSDRLKKKRGRKKDRSRSDGRVYACMRSRDTRPLYEQYLMDCIGRAQTLNLTFTIIAALRGEVLAEYE